MNCGEEGVVVWLFADEMQQVFGDLCANGVGFKVGHLEVAKQEFAHVDLSDLFVADHLAVSFEEFLADEGQLVHAVTSIGEVA